MPQIFHNPFTERHLIKNRLDPTSFPRLRDVSAGKIFPIVLEFAARDSDNWLHRKTRYVHLP
jgi:hypothetical protein